MSKKLNVTGVILDTRTTMTLSEFCHACGVEHELVVEMVNEGVIEPIDQRDGWHFYSETLLRAKRAQRLVRDLGVNWPGAALALDLIERLERLE